jgi:hypothetical protein
MTQNVNVIASEAWQAHWLNSKAQNPSSRQIQISKSKNSNVLSIGILGFDIVQDLNREGRDSFTPRKS